MISRKYWRYRPPGVNNDGQDRSRAAFAGQEATFNISDKSLGPRKRKKRARNRGPADKNSNLWRNARRRSIILALQMRAGARDLELPSTTGPAFYPCYHSLRLLLYSLMIIMTRRGGMGDGKGAGTYREVVPRGCTHREKNSLWRRDIYQGLYLDASV